jgi:hypothetical protein
MLIKFLKPDPRAGDVVRLDSQRAPQFIDAGTAERVQEGSEAPAPDIPPAPDAKPPAQRKAPTVKK